MNPSNLKCLILLLVLTGAGLSCKTFSGLTNRGGIVYTVEIETDEPDKDRLLERAVKITENKINAIGLSSEVSRVDGQPNRISVKVYGADDRERIKKFLFTTFQLELKKVGGSVFQTFPTKEAAERFVTPEQEILPYEENRDPSRPDYIIVEKNAIITGEDIRDASAYSQTDNAGDYQISFTLRPEGAQKFGDWTGKNIGRYLAIVLDKKVLSAPVIRGQIFDQGMIDGRFTKASAEDIALSLKSGYLPARMKVLEEKPFD
jgi:preprotein translocase subunit SecD